jgi:hypothetical protein
MCATWESQCWCASHQRQLWDLRVWIPISLTFGKSKSQMFTLVLLLKIVSWVVHLRWFNYTLCIGFFWFTKSSTTSSFLILTERAELFILLSKCVRYPIQTYLLRNLGLGLFLCFYTTRAKSKCKCWTFTALWFESNLTVKSFCNLLTNI